MKNKLFGPSVLIGLVGSGVSLWAVQEDLGALRGQGEPGSLEKVEPVPSTGRPEARLFGKEFDREEWRGLLGTSDLDLRERHFEDLLRRARIDPLARQFLEELARDTSATELAWTARLALRELGPMRPLARMLPGHPLQMNPQLEEMLREFWTDPDGMTFFLHPPSGGRVPNLQGAGGSSRSVSVHQTPEGARIVVTEDVDGQKKERVYEGASIDQILQSTPDLAKELEELGVALGDASGNVDLRFDLSGGAWKDLLRPFEYGEKPEELFQRFFSDQGAFQRSFSPQSQSRPVRTDVLGVKPLPLTPEHAAELALEPGVGLYVVSTYPGTIAHLLGVRSGHVLLELNDQPLRTDADITTVMRARAPEGELTLLWIDELGQRQTKTWRPPAPAQAPQKVR